MRERPDLTNLPDDVIAYIEALEAQLAAAQDDGAAGRIEEMLEPSEPPTTINLVTVTAGGIAKRTPRHLYFRQRRGGMGIFDLDAPEHDPPAFLAMADADAGLICITNQARAFRVAMSEIPEREVRGRGESILTRFPLRSGERLAVITADTPLHGGSHFVLAGTRGHVRRIARQYLGPNLQPGTVLYDVAEAGAPVASCWSGGSDELLIVTRTGQAIRFAERLVPVRGCLGLRVDQGDEVVAVAAAPATGGVFLLSQDGKGTIRLLNGFAPNKAPGSGGKTAMKAGVVIGAMTIHEGSDVFAISRLSKIIRFQADEVPAKEGVVQGVNCMSLRADECAAFTVN
jgi:DNA gyrase subunit A